MQTETSSLHKNSWKQKHCNSIACDIYITLNDALALQCVIGFATSLYLVMKWFTQLQQQYTCHWKETHKHTWNINKIQFVVEWIIPHWNMNDLTVNKEVRFWYIDVNSSINELVVVNVWNVLIMIHFLQRLDLQLVFWCYDSQKVFWL